MWLLQSDLKIRKPAEVHRNRLTLCPTRPHATGCATPSLTRKLDALAAELCSFGSKLNVAEMISLAPRPAAGVILAFGGPLQSGRLPKISRVFSLPASCVSDGANLDDGVPAGST